MSEKSNFSWIFGFFYLPLLTEKDEKMKASELMIGDIITFKESLENNDIICVEIVAIGYQDTNDVLVSIDGDYACDIIELDDETVGIPLTSEILEKNGWFYPKQSSWMKLNNPNRELWGCIHTDGTLWLYSSGDCDKDESFAEIKYVHELQHALQLCGMDKKIKINRK